MSATLPCTETPSACAIYPPGTTCCVSRTLYMQGHRPLEEAIEDCATLRGLREGIFVCPGCTVNGNEGGRA